MVIYDDYKWTIPFLVAEVCAICLGGINESQVVSPGYPWRVGSFEATSKVGNARLTGRTWSDDLRVVSWSLLVEVLFFAGSERELSCCIETCMYILYIQCFALWLDLKFTFSLDFRDVSILICCFLKLWVYRHSLAPNDSHGKFPCAQSKAKCVLAWWIASDVASFCSSLPSKNPTKLAQFRYL